VHHEFDNRSAVPEWADYFDRWREQSHLVRQRSDAVLELRYGEHDRQRIDFFPAGPKAHATFVFIHGGYWQWNSKEEFAFLATAANEHHLHAAFVGYGLAPETPLEQIIGHVRQAVAWLAQRRGHPGSSASPDLPLLLVGWSAGAHLAASALAHASVGGFVGLSGIYDLAPLLGNPLNEALGLDAQRARALSAPVDAVQPNLPMLIAYGERELPALVEQSKGFDAALARAGHSNRLLHALGGLNHYSVLDDLGDPGSSLWPALLSGERVSSG